MKAALGLTAVIALLVAGCSVTQRVAVKEDDPAICAFLGDVCHQLKPGGKDEAGLRWVNPNSQPTKYNKVLVNVVGFFGAETTKVKPEEQEKLTALFQQSLTEALSKNYPVVQEPGPGVMKIQVALMDAEAATPGVRSVSMVVPQARLLGTGYRAISGKYPFVGGGQAAFKASDAETGEVLGAAVDRRVGGGNISTAAQWQWGDAENAIKAWSEMVAKALHAYTSGEKKP